MGNISNYIEEFEMSLLSLDKQGADETLQKAMTNRSPIEVAGKLVAATLQKIGESWEQGRVALSQIYMSGLICEELIEKYIPAGSPVRISQPKMAIAVFEDYHLLGKRIVASTLRSAGYELTDLGGGLSVDELVEIIKREKYQILLLSVLMLNSAMHIKELKEKLKDINVKIIVGGAPFRFDEELWIEVGADGYGKDSSEAIEIVGKIMEGLA